ncbi:MAG: hypothetical protein G01um101448_142 [Parcubacteria group bacterium Gr01-1014_48]|nr:MAG: tRNA-specific 2-thiouridylase [Parcubacteria group bacterium Greene0416_14]TSC74415.1 MAG: hypothetical protein G01um101448_142 [Parcubacteria group bacterium Gr01-1014_48]TSD01268.1 MAG: tRNA-specific 2-thiouridylase [Parcubacteria group bacterium Greene1014_15]TSD08411.1 MAG: tRNA-specific 2-thiouridylase [Parcubacteria group bacterium Greene0714_4]
MARILNKHKQTNTSLKRKVFVGMSGGVDSSVSAALLQRQGYDVTGVFIKVWQPDFAPCPWREERLDAMRVAAHLRIPFLTFDFEKEYKQYVVDYMIAEYRAGRTPNPDVMCNKSVKFGIFLEKAHQMGADFIATGHYARILQDDNSHKLLTGNDENKDQSYFLWTLTQEQLAHTLFPVGPFHKDEVRKYARDFGLSNADKKDSQGICFMGKLNIKEFLAHFVKTSPGNVLDTDGTIIGTHDGALFYTIGERHGFTVKKQKRNEAPRYVVNKDMENNTITVCPRIRETARENHTIELGAVNWISDIPTAGKVYYARTRYRQKLFPCTVTDSSGSWAVVPQAPYEQEAPGQSLVLYDGNICLGGGIIA